MTCPTLEQLAAYQAGWSAEQSAVRLHVDCCPSCREQLVALLRAQEALAHIPAPTTPDLWPAIAARLPEPRQSWWRGWWRVATLAGASAVAAAAVILTQLPEPSLPMADASASAMVADHTLLNAQDPLADRGAVLVSLTNGGAR